MRSVDADLRIRVLGSAAGGGSPQWNCRCSVCERVRRGEDGVRRRTQTSIAVSADGDRWAVVNASPDIGSQIAANPVLHPQREGRHSPIEAVVLTGGEVDQVGGLLTLREREPFALYATNSVHKTLGQSPIFDVLDEEVVARRRLVIDKSIELVDGRGEDLGIGVESFRIPGKIPLYQEKPGEEPELAAESEDTVALRIEAGESYFYFAPGCAVISEKFKNRIRKAPLLFFDGTLWRDDELVAAGLGKKTGRRMGHVSISGAQGAMAGLDGLGVGRKIFIHINNTNPVLLPTTAERAEVEKNGWEVARDGMEICLP